MSQSGTGSHVTPLLINQGLTTLVFPLLRMFNQPSLCVKMVSCFRPGSKEDSWKAISDLLVGSTDLELCFPISRTRIRKRHRAAGSSSVTGVSAPIPMSPASKFEDTAVYPIGTSTTWACVIGARNRSKHQQKIILASDRWLGLGFYLDWVPIHPSTRGKGLTSHQLRSTQTNKKRKALPKKKKKKGGNMRRKKTIQDRIESKPRTALTQKT